MFFLAQNYLYRLIYVSLKVTNHFAMFEIAEERRENNQVCTKNTKILGCVLFGIVLFSIIGIATYLAWPENIGKKHSF